MMKEELMETIKRDELKGRRDSKRQGERRVKKAKERKRIKKSELQWKKRKRRKMKEKKRKKGKKISREIMKFYRLQENRPFLEASTEEGERQGEKKQKIEYE